MHNNVGLISETYEDTSCPEKESQFSVHNFNKIRQFRNFWHEPS